MKVLLISDTHGITAEFFNLIADYKNDVDAIIHCGDSELHVDDPIWNSVDVVVKGNVDYDNNYDKHVIYCKSNVHFFVAHGHMQHVNMSRINLAQTAQQANCTIACYGHTHVLNVEQFDNVICINPGSFNHSRGVINERTYALLTFDLQQRHVVIEFYTHDKRLLSSLTQLKTY